MVLIKDHPEKQKNIGYIISGLEICPDTGRQHWQTYIQLKQQLSMQQIKRIFEDEGIHIEKQRALDNDAAIEYCKKDGVWEEWGTPKRQGERTDIPSMEDMEEFKTIEDLEQQLDPTTYCRMKRNITEMWKEARNRKLRRKADEEFKQAELRPWQQHVLADVPTVRRKITWIWEATGNTGKTYLAEYMRVNHEALVVNTTSFKDVAYLYDGHPFVIFDLTRTEWDPNYSTIEAFTNPSITSTKYEPTVKPCIARVIILSNSPPNLAKLSLDRWNVVNVDDVIKCLS